MRPLEGPPKERRTDDQSERAFFWLEHPFSGIGSRMALTCQDFLEVRSRGVERAEVRELRSTT